MPMRAWPILILSSLLLSFLFFGISDDVSAASKPWPKEPEETEYPAEELLFAIIVIFIISVAYGVYWYRRKGK
jgi:hypothetical protein